MSKRRRGAFFANIGKFQSAKKSPCWGCVYWRGLGNNGTANQPHCCHFIIDHGFMRPCEPGAGCTVRVEKGKKK